MISRRSARTIDLICLRIVSYVPLFCGIFANIVQSNSTGLILCRVPVRDLTVFHPVINSFLVRFIEICGYIEQPGRWLAVSATFCYLAPTAKASTHFGLSFR